MKVTRYVQSCLLIEKGDTNILIDPGTDFREVHKEEDLPKLNAVIYTHEHADHFDSVTAESFAKRGILIVANESTARLIKGKARVVNDGEDFSIGAIEVKALELPHCLMPNGAEGPQNTGYLFDKIFFDPGDGKEYKGLKVPALALPITGPDISMKDAFDFARQAQAQTVIPVHYDKLGANPDVYSEFAQRLTMPFAMEVLGQEESLELNV